MSKRLAIALVGLLCPWIAQAGDLGMAGAISGAGQGMSNALATMQAAEAQRMLMEERHRLDMERLARQAQAAKALSEADDVEEAKRAAMVRSIFWQLLAEEALRLKAEKGVLDQERERLNALPASPERQIDLEAYRKRADDYALRVKRFNLATQK